MSSSAGQSNGVLYGTNLNFTGSTPHVGQITADGQLLIGNALFPFIRTGILTSPDATISVGYSDPDITLQAAGLGAFQWIEVTATGPTSMDVYRGYVASNAGLVTLNLPLTSAFGTVIRVCGKGAGGWLIAQNAGQNIQIGNVSSTSGVGGSVASTQQFDALELLCTEADTTWTAINNPVGALDIT